MARPKLSLKPLGWEQQSLQRYLVEVVGEMHSTERKNALQGRGQRGGQEGGNLLRLPEALGRTDSSSPAPGQGPMGAEQQAVG